MNVDVVVLVDDDRCAVHVLLLTTAQVLTTSTYLYFFCMSTVCRMRMVEYE